MAFEPFDWNVVVVGRWNIAILTPAGVRKYIFKLDALTKLNIAVPLDGVSPYMISHGETTVIPGSDRIIIKAKQENYNSLEKAMEAGRNVLISLPETPVSAAGFNIRLRGKTSPGELIEVVATSDIDSKLSSLDFYRNILVRKVNRSIEYKNGIINLEVSIEKNQTSVLFNFHKDSTKNKELVEWLNLSREEIKSIVDNVAEKLGLEIDVKDKEEENEQE